MDDATADLILALQLQDLEEVQQNDNDHSSGDIVYALSLYREELRGIAATVRDHRFGEEIGVAEDPDSLPTKSGLCVIPNVDQMLAESLALLTVPDEATLDTGNGPTSAKNQGRKECDACGDMATNYLCAPCGIHYYCKNCTTQLFDFAMTDESLFPSRCCRQEIPLDLARSILTPAKAQDFAAKWIELSTLDRTYCHNPTCQKFIAPTSIDGEKATCSCALVTCAVCKKQAHIGDCPRDPAHDLFLAAAKEAGFQQCFNCLRMLELSVG